MKPGTESEVPAILGVLRVCVWVMPAFFFLMTCVGVFFLHHHFSPSADAIYPFTITSTICLSELILFGYCDMRLRYHQMQIPHRDVPSQERWKYIKLFCGMQFVVAPTVGLWSGCVVEIFLYFS